MRYRLVSPEKDEERTNDEEKEVMYHGLFYTDIFCLFRESSG